jgi:glucosyl-dolichyl phosphate glucuronosyltransferase
MIDISVILCTYNRCQSLFRALESLAALEVPSRLTWEVLVIDNNSNDETPRIVEQVRARHPGRFHYYFEPSQGKSFALNTGIHMASGRILAFIDDDVVADPLWLHNLTADILAGKCSGTGGKILLDRNFEPPDWLPMKGPFSLAGMLAVFDLGDQPKLLDRAPFGTNMAFLRRMFDKYGMFRTDMGPSPGSEIRNEDVEFCHRLMHGGEELIYEPAAVVYHAVPESRRTQRYFLRFWFDHGRASIREGGVRAAIAGIPRRYFNIVKTLTWSGPAAVFCWLIACDPKTRFYRKGWVWMLAGEISEWWRSRSPRSIALTNIAAPQGAAPKDISPSA